MAICRLSTKNNIFNVVVYIFSLAGCPTSAVENIYQAMRQGVEHQALGMLICDWSGKGHVTDPLFSLPSFIAVAGMSWNKSVDQV